MKIDLRDWDLIVVNSSAGKDSQAMLDVVARQAERENVPDRLLVAHADLGKAEWPGTRELAEEHAEHYGLRFAAIKRPQGDLLQHVRQRGKWPSSTNRYCTSDHKRGQVGKLITEVSAPITKRQGYCQVLNCFGFRAEESPARAKRPVFAYNDRASTQRRIVCDWLPIHEWKLDEVWSRIRQAGTRHHPAYDLGMPRLSCRFCIFAPRAALLISGHANTELLEEYVQVEEEIGHTFQHNKPIREVLEAVRRGERPDASITDAWNM